MELSGGVCPGGKCPDPVNHTYAAMDCALIATVATTYVRCADKERFH